MLRSSDRTLIEKLKRLLIEQGVPLYKTIVFGSRARGDAVPDSDLDVLVLVEYLNPALRKTISHCAWEVGFEAGILIQTVVMTREQAEQGPEQSSLLMLAVKEEGIPV
ncbi:MAG: nucleotidyltransferase domain-containing protein [Deltaproteobacteria bacterium]|nr:nucleotidyltransferase domain-containing protein [Deltaproteobacteria bacterium]